MSKTATTAKTKRWTVSLLTMFLVFTIVALSISHFRTSWLFSRVHDTATDATTVVLQPVGHFSVQAGDAVTLGVRVVGPSDTRFVGLATNVKVLETRPFPNYVECVLTTSPELVKRIDAAKDVSMLWFDVVPYSPAHNQTIKNDTLPTEFLQQHPEYQPAGSDHWGHRGRGPRVTPPGTSVLATMKRQNGQLVNDIAD